MLIPSLVHISLTFNFPLGHCASCGSIDWHSWHSSTTVLTAAFDIAESIRLAKYSILLIPGYPLWWCTVLIWLKVHLLTGALQTTSMGSISSFIMSSHLCGILVSLSAWFWFDLTSVMLTNKLYSSISFSRIPSLLWMSISLEAFVCTLAFLIRVFYTYPWTHAELVNRCSPVAFCWSDALKDGFQLCHIDMLNVFLSMQPARIFHNVPFYLKVHSSCKGTPSTHHFPCVGLSCCTLLITSINMFLKGLSITLSSHLDVTAVALCFNKGGCNIESLTNRKVSHQS